MLRHFIDVEKTDVTVNAIIKYVRLILEAVFIYFFINISFPFGNNSNLILRIWVFTISIFALFIFLRLYSNKDKAKNLFNSTIIFFIIFSLTQALRNILALKGAYVLSSEVTHYLILLFILIYNFNKIRYVDTGLVLFIVYSFRIFDSNLFDNEFTLIHALTIILALRWLDDVYSKRTSLVKANSIFVPFGVLMLCSFLSCLKTVCPYNHLMQTAVMINFIFIAFLIGNYVRDVKQIKLIIFTLFFMGVILSALAANVILYKEGPHNVLNSRIWIDRTSPFRIHPNSIAGYLSVLLFLVIGSAPFHKKKSFMVKENINVTTENRILGLSRSDFLEICIRALILIMAVILFLTYSRFGIFSFIFSAGILFILRYREGIKFIKMRIFSIFLSIIAVNLLIFFTPIKQNIFARIFSPATSQTFYSCKNSLKAVKDNLLFGLGFDNYYILSKYAKDQIFAPGGAGMGLTRNAVWTPTHSLYLGIAFGLGIFGLLAFMWLIVNTVIYFIKLNKRIVYDSFESRLLQGIFVAFAAVIIHGILAMTFHLTILPAFFWILIGLIMAMGNIVNFNKKLAFGQDFQPVSVVGKALYTFPYHKIKICAFNCQRPLGLFVILTISVYWTVSSFFAEKFYSIALENFNYGRPNKAINNINQAKIFIPLHPKFYELEAEARYASGSIDDAIKSYKQALALKRDFAFYHTRIGQLYKQKKMYAYALLEFEKAINLDKYGACYQEHYSDLGSLYRDLGNKEEAILQFKTALMIQPDVACIANWGGKDYLEEILNRAYQDYSALKRKDSLAAEQILFNLNHARQCKRLKW